MRTPTPRGVPAFLLAPNVRAGARVGPAPAPLMGPVKVVCGSVEHELRHGSVLLGRGSECDLIIEDSLISRVHARLQVDGEGVKVEDLYSTNGVFVNGERIMQARLLHTGDRLFLGNHEVTFVEIRTDPEAAPSVPPSSVSEYPDPLTRPNVAAATDIPITARADALDLLGNLARRLANDVKAEQAPRLLGPHLKGILRGASAGLVVPEALCEIASEYAVDLAHWTSDARWLDYVVELHLITKRVMSAASVSALQRSERWVGALNRSLLDYYVGSFAPRLTELSREEKARLATLRRVLKKK
jgi:Inner membrane component of T3SS, cytoplasmic domain